MLLPVVSFAEDAAHAAGGGHNDWVAIGAGIAIGVAAFGGALGQGKIGAAYIENASRNPQAVSVMKTQLILSLIFVETLVLFSLLIALTLAGKV